ncbi:uncharacterized protein LOC117121088, partial [Anneissia japonica]|uniref:uncharacterized protein LOC117121088 n=1 Tax=Anneissia japonica TaxID=1529436 RepID=UPI0014255CB4
MSAKRSRTKNISNKMKERGIPDASDTDTQLVVEVDVHQEDTSYIQEDLDVQDEEHSMNQDNDETASSPRSPSPPPSAVDTSSERPEDSKKKKRERAYAFTEQEEAAIGEWYCDNSCLYNKRHRDFKNADKKRRLMEEKANSFDPPCTYKQLKMFLDSMRSQVGKITKRKSGQGTQLMSDRDAWVVQTFGFLEKHIVRIPSRPTAKFPDIKTSDSMAIPSGGDDDDDEKEEEEDNRQGDAPHAMETVSTDSISDEAGTRGKVKNKSRPKCKATKTKESEVLGKLLT